METLPQNIEKMEVFFFKLKLLLFEPCSNLQFWMLHFRVMVFLVRAISLTLSNEEKRRRGSCIGAYRRMVNQCDDNLLQLLSQFNFETNLPFGSSFIAW